MKLEILVPKINEFLEQFTGFKLIHEYKIDKPDYLGFADLVAIAPTNECIIIDFKYSNNIKNYLDSGQLHIYKHYLEQDGLKVKRMGYLFIPKVQLKQGETEDLFTYRKRVLKEVEQSDVQFVPIEFDEMEVIYFYNTIKKIESAKEYPKNVSGNCFQCNPYFAPNYLEVITNEEGEIEMILPKNERRKIEIDKKPDFWIYGDSYVGKSTFVDNVENVLFLNTDGNTDNTTAPVIMIKDEVKKEGRRIIRKLAWEKFLEVIDALETEDNDYEAVAIDLVEDLYEHCRYYVFEQNGWEHESDGAYGKGWSKVTTEWQKAIKRLKALGYQVVYISKELREEINLKGGAKRTIFKPNINDKVANFLTGTVDLTMRAFADSNDNRLLQLKKEPNVFGGGRFEFQVDTCPLDYDEFLEELKAAQEGKATKTKTKKQHTKDDEIEKVDEFEQYEDEKIEIPEDLSSLTSRELINLAEDLGIDTDEIKRKKDIIKAIEAKREEQEDKQEETEQEEKPNRTRRRREREEVEDDETPPGEESDYTEEEETPCRRRRRRKSE